MFHCWEKKDYEMIDSIDEENAMRIERDYDLMIFC